MDETNELLEKVIVTTQIGNPAGSGLLTKEQADKFIDYMFDSTVLAGQVQVKRMSAPEAEYDRIGVGKRLMRGATEAVDTGENQGVIFSKYTLSTKKLRLDWELSTETLEDNIEGADLEDHIARLMATQVGNDLEDLAINGDTTSSDKLLKVFDGWKKRAITGTADGAARFFDHGGQPLNRVAANKALKMIPRVYMQKRNQLRFFTGSNLIQDYIFSLSVATDLEALASGIVQNGPVRTEGAAGYTMGNMFGIPVQEVPLFDEAATGTYSGAAGQHGQLWLTFPKNLVWGVKREVRVHREFAIKKDTIEYTVYVRAGVTIENPDAFVVIGNVKVAA